MKNNSISPAKDIWIPLIFLVLGIAAPIIATKVFKDAFFPALIVTVLILIGLFLAVLSSKVIKIIASVTTIIVAIILSVYVPNSERPNFEINIIGLPYKDDKAYYVTDAMVRTQGDLSAFTDFEITPPVIEIVPHYSGDEKFGNVVLRISGDSTETKDILLWHDFDRTSQTQTLNLDLADIIKISGIKKTVDEIDSSLMLGEKPYQEANLRFEIIRLSEPDKPYEPKMVLPIKNSPWIERVSVLSRNGMVVDYALENLGANATFYCRMNITKTLSDVGESDHVVWSGTYEIKSPKCGSFALKTGETYKVTIPLNQESLGQDLARGRYIVQVYTFTERKDLVFKDSYTYENSNNLWVLANSGDIRAFVVCNDPGKSCADSVTLPIEKETIRVYPYSSKDEWDNGATYFVVRTYPVNNYSTNHYVLDYWIDPQKTGWVGFGIWFENLVDVSAFNSIRFKLLLDQSLHPIYLDVKGKIGDTYKTARVEIGAGTYGEPKFEEQKITIPFSAFEGIDWTKVDTLYFGMDSFMVPDAEKHEIQISEVEFVR
jgi:hypothetical protein